MDKYDLVLDNAEYVPEPENIPLGEYDAVINSYGLVNTIDSLHINWYSAASSRAKHLFGKFNKYTKVIEAIQALSYSEKTERSKKYNLLSGDEFIRRLKYSIELAKKHKEEDDLIAF